MTVRATWRMGARAYPGTTQIFWLPTIISGTGKATSFKFGRNNHGVHLNKRPLKILEKREHGRIHGLTKFFWLPPVITGTGKATNFKCCTHIYSINRKKSQLKISGKVIPMGVVRDSRKIQSTHMWGASRGHLCNSSAFLFRSMCFVL